MTSWIAQLVFLLFGAGAIAGLVSVIAFRLYKSGKKAGEQELRNKEAAANETINKRALDALSRGAHARRIGVQHNDPNDRDSAGDS